MLKRYFLTLLLASWVAITFSQALQNTAATRGAVRVFSQQRGGLRHDGAQDTAAVSGRTLTLDPATDFKPGETLFASTTPAVMASGGTMAHGQFHQFTSGTGRSTCLPSSELTGDFSTSVVLGDVDGDGDLDQVATNVLNLTVSVRLNGGDATGSDTGIVSGSSTVGVGSNPRSIAAGERHRPRSNKGLTRVSKHWHQWPQSVRYIWPPPVLNGAILEQRFEALKGCPANVEATALLETNGLRG